MKYRSDRRPVRVTGIQAAIVGHAAQLEAWRAQFSPREWAELLEIIERMHEHERRRAGRWLRRAA